MNELGWLAVALLVLTAAACLLWPLWRPRPPHAASPLAFHRSQLVELDEEERLGLIEPAAARQARLEIERRLLAEAGTPVTETRTLASPTARVLASLLLLLLLLGSLPLYLALGRVELPDRPLSAREAERKEWAEWAKLLDELSAQVAANPSRAEPAFLLGQLYLRLGRAREAIDSFRQALARESRPEIQVALGEALVISAGAVSKEAESLFRASEAFLPQDPRPGFFLGLAEAAAGKNESALQRWLLLAERFPDDPLLRQSLLERIPPLLYRLPARHPLRARLTAAGLGGPP